MKTAIHNVPPQSPVANASEVWVKWSEMRANIENEIKKAFGASPEEAIGSAVDAAMQRGNASAVGRTNKFKLPKADDDHAAQLVNNANSRGYKLPKAEG